MLILKYIKYRVLDIISYIQYDIPRGIKNLIRWFPLIWSDRDFDYHFLLSLLKQKITFLKDNFKGEKYRNENLIKDLMVAENLIKRIIEDKYEGFLLDKHSEKYGDMEFLFEDIPNSTNKLMVTDYTKPLSEVEKKEAKKERGEIYKYSTKQKNNDVDYLFKHISKNILNWWS